MVLIIGTTLSNVFVCYLLRLVNSDKFKIRSVSPVAHQISVHCREMLQAEC